jgi:fermentation-respiration switch protein FrsA (DUF1100 family)
VRSSVKKVSVYLFGIILAVLLFCIIMVSILERQMIYYPARYPEGYWQPDRFGITVEDCWFTTGDGLRLHGWYAKGDVSELDVTLLWFHGNAGNITHRLDNMRDLLKLGIDVFIIDYRGYGKSEGEPDETGLYEDGLAAYDYLVNEKGCTGNSIVLFGRSLGAAVAVDVATKRPVRGMILESAFTNAKAMAKIIMPHLPVGSLISSRFDSLKKIPHIDVPILFTHGDRDTIVPIELGKKLFDAANQPKHFYTIVGADHNDTYLVGGVEYYTRIIKFLEDLSFADE